MHRDHAQRRVGDERELTGQELEQADAERVEVRPDVDLVDAQSLLGGGKDAEAESLLRELLAEEPDAEGA